MMIRRLGLLWAGVAMFSLLSCQGLPYDSQRSPTPPGAAAPPTKTTEAPPPPTPPHPPLTKTTEVPPAPPPPPPIQPYDEAVLSAATMLFNNAQLPRDSRHVLVIDPLIDGVTGAQTITTHALGRRLSDLVAQRYGAQYEVQRFSAANVAKGPVVLIGTFTGVNAQRQTAGQREAYRICLALVDFKAGKIVSKGLAFSNTQGVDLTPLTYFQDSPAWTEDPATLGYIRTCQGTKTGEPINAMYVDRILSAALIADAIDSYNAARYRESLEQYQAALRTPGGDQLRAYNGVYLANWKLGRQAEAQAAFTQLVDYSLANKRLAVKFLFRPGSTAFWPDPKVSGPYPVWLHTIAQEVTKSGACLEVVGHTSATGPEPLNERLSTLRAEYVKQRLETESSALAKRSIAAGAGSKNTLVGNGRDDASDALDRRVEFKVIGCQA
jgi:outer membrane protein OmpA-like peptidoglycan-associated protein